MQLLKVSNKLYRIIILLMVITSNGCIPQRETLYFQDLANRKNYENPYGELVTITEKYVLRPNDQLFIHVTTSNPKLSEFFNPFRGFSGAGTQMSSLYTYLIDDNMDIDFPFVGKINLAGSTLSEAKQKITVALQPFLADAQVTVRLSGASFMALGEFNRVGRIEMGKEQVTVFEAVALAGDVKPFGKKREIKIVRPTPDGSIFFYIDLTDRNLVDSDHFYIYNNDIIYVRPMRARAWGIGESFSFGVAGSIIALYLTIQSLLK